LLQQLLEVITTADVLRDTITLVFENAVEQPTYCAMYAGRGSYMQEGATACRWG
jgi:hypothetical protein